MTKKTRSPLPGWVCNLLASLRKDFKSVGISVEAGAEKVPGLRMYRVNCVSKQFAKLQFSERQSLAWRIAKNAVGQDRLMRVTMILTLTPAELGD